MSNLAIFGAFEAHDIRWNGDLEHPEWVAKDVCDVLGIERARDAVRDFDEDQKGAVTIRTPGGNQQMLTVTEAGLYRLVFTSRKPSAKSFQRWVFHEVLPSIRKTGSYSTQQHFDPEIRKLELQVRLAELELEKVKLERVYAVPTPFEQPSRTKPKSKKPTITQKQMVSEYLKKVGAATIEQIMEATGIHSRSVYQVLHRMHLEQLITKRRFVDKLKIVEWNDQEKP